MSRDTFFRFNRFMLLGGIAVCALLPFLRMETSGEPTFVQGQFLQLEAVLLSPAEFVPQPEEKWISGEAGEDAGVFLDEAEGKTGIWESVKRSLPVYIYIAGCLVVLVSLFMAYVKMVGIIRNNRKVAWEGYTLVLSDVPVCPFCWGKYIVIPENDYESHFNEILLHERMHVMKHHTLDLLIMEGFIVLFWFNPAVWLLKKELREIHEYEADNGVLNQGIDATKYQLLLVKKAAGSRLYSIANSFNHSKLKNRITMMLKEKSNQWARLKALLFIPPTALLMLAFARPETVLLEAGNVSEVKITQISEENQHDSQIVSKKKSEDTESGEIVTYGYRNKKVTREIQDTSQNITFVLAKEKNMDRGAIKDIDAAHTVQILVNAAGQISFNGELIDAGSVKERLKKILLSNTTGERYLVVLQKSEQTDSESWKNLSENVDKAHKEVRAQILKENPTLTETQLDEKCPVVFRYLLPKNTQRISTPPPPVPLVSLMYTDGSERKVSLAFYSEKEIIEKLNTSDFREDMKVILQVNRQRDDELQKRIIELLREKGVKGEIATKKGTPAPPLAPLQMTFVYNSGQKMDKDVWQIANAKNFIDYTPVDRVKEVILTITPNCKDEMKKAIRDYLTQKGFTQISEKQLEHN